MSATASPILSVEGLSKTYANGFRALEAVDLSIRRGEIFALLGPNGAGKTTLISIVCGITNASSGTVTVDGYDTVRKPREARQRVGLVPQELSTDMFETVWDTVKFSRGLFGQPKAPEYLDRLLVDLALADKKHSKIMTLSGGMKRRVLIAKALSHEPSLLFLDEPTAGVDVELRRQMWSLIGALRQRGVTVILTTHYLEEAEEIADRIGVLNRGKLILVESKSVLMEQMGQRQLILHLQHPLARLPDGLADEPLELAEDGTRLVYTFDASRPHTGIADLLRRLAERGIDFKDLQTRQSSLEEIFVNLIGASL